MKTFDFSNCRHEFFAPSSKTPSGSRRVACMVCGRRFTIHPKRRTRPLSDQEVRAVADACARGAESTRSAAARFNLSPSVVQKYARRIRIVLNLPPAKIGRKPA